MMPDGRVATFLGDPIEDQGEQHFLRRLHRDLESVVDSGLIFANFIADGRQQRQIDFLLCLPHQVVHVELKALTPSLPLVAGVNGAWEQILPDGTRRNLGSNGYRQASNGTYAISDVMRSLAQKAQVPKADRFFAVMETVVCVYPEIPLGSQIGTDRYVRAIGYADLLAMIQRPGKRHPWSQRHWLEFARSIGLYREAESNAREQATDVEAMELADYRRRFRTTHAQNLHELVPVSASVDGISVPQPDVVELAAASRTVLLLGDSGLGKSHTARHAGLTLTDLGHLVVWMRCAEYQRGQFRALLSRGTAPFSSADALGLIRNATSQGILVILIADGLNECPAELRGELLEELSAFRLRHPAAMVITSTAGPEMPEALHATEIQMEHPVGVERTAILESYGAGDPARFSEAFSTPFELAVAAECDADLDPTATLGQLLDSYVRRFAETETHRAALRTLAAAMGRECRTSMQLIDVVTLLHGRSDHGLPVQAIDEILADPLLRVFQGRVSFRHEILAHYLAAEDLRLSADDGTALGRVLALPQNQRLRDHALSMEANRERLTEALSALADATINESAALGRLGPMAQTESRAIIASLLAEARSHTALGIRYVGEVPLIGYWEGAHSWSVAERSWLTAAGRLLWKGLFAGEVSRLLDQTDLLIAREAAGVGPEHRESAISLFTAAAYASFGRGGQRALAVSLVVSACESIHSWTQRDQEQSSALEIAFPAGRESWGRLFLGATLLDPTLPEDREFLPVLLERAWLAGGYHLRLRALETAQRFSTSVEPAVRDRVTRTLESIDVDNIFLSTALVDALASYGAIDSGTSVDDIHEKVAEVLRREPDAAACSEAASIVSRQWENEAIVGPYSEALGMLPITQRLRLFALARQDPSCIWRSWVIEQMGAAVSTHPEIVSDALGEEATRLIVDGHMPQDDIAAHLGAVRAWARIRGSLPTVARDLSCDEHAWRLVDELVLGLERQALGMDVGASMDRIWQALLGDCATAAVDVLFQVAWSEKVTSVPEITPHDQIINAFPSECRELLTRGLVNRRNLTSRFPHDDSANRDEYIVTTLGKVGDAATAEILRGYLLDDALGSSTVAAIKAIEGS